jgi:polyferredoxin
VSWLRTHRYWLARRSTQLLILLLSSGWEHTDTSGWCGSRCPLGAFYALVGRRSWLRIGFAAERCDHCGDCAAICPEAQVLDFEAMPRAGFIDAGEYLNCARCLEICPRDAFHVTLRLRRGAVQPLREGDRHATQSAA